MATPRMAGGLRAAASVIAHVGLGIAPFASETTGLKRRAFLKDRQEEESGRVWSTRYEVSWTII